VRARDDMARAYDDVASGEHRARLWRLDRDVEHVLVRALGDAVQARTRGMSEHAKRAVMQSGLHALASRETARAFERARGTRALHAVAVRVADELRAFFDERARAIHFAGVRVLLDPRFVDRLVKESALHVLLELSVTHGQRGGAVRVISRPSASSFRATVVKRLRGDLPDVDCVVMDEANAPPGYSHASVLARERGTGLLVVHSLADVPRGIVHLDGDVLRRGPGPKRTRATARAVLHAPKLDSDPATITLRALGALPLDERRAIAGEKAAVLADLLAVVPTIDGVVVPFARVARWVRDAGMFDAWMRGDVDARALRRKLRPDDVSMMSRAPLIARSSGSAEDRPFKSDAGIALSVGGLRTQAQLTRALADIVAATWSKRSLDAQARAGVAMKRVWPAILMQRDLSRDALLSGVAISRGRDGAFGAISYQCVRGAGGAVRGGRNVEEGHVSPVEHVVTRGPALLSKQRARVLGAAVLQIERVFFDVIEPGAGHAVDVEWLWTKRGLVIVQARALAR
jgi:hypothetical protein